MAFEDKKLTCRDCGNEFVWTGGEQQFFADKGLNNPPSRCKECRNRVKQARADRPMFKIICKQCGKEGEVPFEPHNPADVLCKECFENQANSNKTVEKPAESPEPNNQPEA